MKLSASGGAALRVSTFDTPQHAAAPTVSAKANSGPPDPSSTPATTIPARATHIPNSLALPGRSPSTTIATTAVNTAWI
ncbi:hypothetical protein GCM10010289_65430 [Streptomyces violascens]|uniref:Uncharacterized protein n=1 Tax=Streptomyces violascens TaxID=67381 RepID=A0ABQ3QND7_9ACTN|nr:hypothetical protein GCM10010289_65430 [Streptomyces violascens]GHI38777.1 hypothetical protein Sviol_31850 [Streptomyces violascens]